METALSAMKTLSTEVRDERLRLESVTYAAAIMRATWPQGCQNERAALETADPHLREQADTMGEIIFPQQPQPWLIAARSAKFRNGEVGRGIGKRIADLKENRLGDHIEFAKSMAWPTPCRTGDTLALLSRGSRRNWKRPGVRWKGRCGPVMRQRCR
jgi:hypothetical protein